MADRISSQYDLRVESFGTLILSELTSTFNGVTNWLYMDIINTQDQKVREALIAMGWTPPPDGQP